ncbi:hypothetical protein HZH66_004010 [Vespula vulgaris]|uniref:Uncharacterized protein n=1 Tax=Vespula vulgaris TaxID=7454 RepID=A0A834KHX6_VESVU|nr:hypothetical protein HZH66_004010 [Vespula vulgaris]
MAENSSITVKLADHFKVIQKCRQASYGVITSQRKDNAFGGSISWLRDTVFSVVTDKTELTLLNEGNWSHFHSRGIPTTPMGESTERGRSHDLAHSPRNSRPLESHSYFVPDSSILVGNVRFVRSVKNKYTIANMKFFETLDDEAGRENGTGRPCWQGVALLSVQLGIFSKQLMPLLHFYVIRFDCHIIARVLGKQDLPRYRKQNSCSMEKENILIDIGQDDALPNDNEVSCERSS